MNNQERLFCIGGEDHKGGTMYISSKCSSIGIVLIENNLELVICIAHLCATAEAIQTSKMKVA